MPAGGTIIDPEAFLRAAISTVAVAAHARGVSIAVHVDLRLPARLIASTNGLERFLRRGLKRTLEAGRTNSIALALWLDGQGSDGSLRMMLEVCRKFDDATRPTAPLAELWALPLGDGRANPQSVRDDNRVELVAIPIEAEQVPVLAAAAAQQYGDRWRGLLSGVRFLETRDPMYDRARMQASIEAIGASVDFARSAPEAIGLLRAGADQGRPVTVAALGNGASDMDPVDFARQVRADPELAGTRLILTSAPGGRKPSEDSAGLFDVSLSDAGPRRRIFDVVYELLRAENTVRGIAPGPRQSGDIPALAGRRILIAEDVETNQMLLRAILAPTGASFEIVEDGAAAIERHRAEAADLILMDLKMPGVGGIMALKKIRAMEGASGKVPVLALTAYAMSTDRQKAMAAGMDGYLAKPILIEEFYAALREFLLPAEAR